MQSQGGKARAQKLSAEERKAIAAKAAAARWSLPKASHEGELNIGGWVIPCYVLEDETRLMSQRGFMEIIGMKGRKNIGHRIANLIDNPAAKSQKIKKLVLDTQSPRKFLTPNNVVAHGYDGQLLIDYCKTLIELRRIKALPDYAMEYAGVAEKFVLALAGVAIAAIIDEATGYQYVRDKKALEILLDRYLLKEFSAWAKRFPDDFYHEVLRLKGKRLENIHKRPGWLGKVTNDLVYERIEVGLLEELRLRNPYDSDKKRRKGYHHCLLTDDLGVPALAQHLHTVIKVMSGFRDGEWTRFHEFLGLILPKKDSSVQLLLDLSEHK